MKTFYLFIAGACMLTTLQSQAQTWYKTGYNIPDDQPTYVAANNNGVFVTNHTNVYRSTNGGITFTEVYDPGISYGPHGIFCVADTLYMHRSVNYSRSTDNGATWTDLGAGHLTDRYVSADGKVIIVSGATTGASGYISRNSGYTWTALTFSAPMTAFWGFGELNDSLACIGSQAGFVQNLYMSGDRGVTWIEKTHDVPNTAGITGGVINFSALDNNAVVISSDFMPTVHDGLFLSNDFGHSFAPVITSPALTTNSLISRFRTYDEIMYVYGKDVNGGFLYKSVDKGITWTDIFSNLPNEEVRDLNERGGYLYVTFRNSTTSAWEVWTTDVEGAGTGIDEITAASAINIYPNPAADQITIEYNGKNTFFELYNINMQKLWDVNTQGNKIDISMLQPGVYFLKSQNGQAVKRFVVAR